MREQILDMVAIQNHNFPTSFKEYTRIYTHKLRNINQTVESYNNANLEIPNNLQTKKYLICCNLIKSFTLKRDFPSSYNRW